MAQQYDNELRGVLFKNTKKEKPNQPDYTGRCQVNGTTYWLAGWIKQGRNGGDKFLSLKLTEPEERPGGADDEVPF